MSDPGSGKGPVAAGGRGEPDTGVAQDPSELSPSPSPSPGTALSVVKLVLVLGAIVAVFLATGLGALLIFIAALLVMVILHELGHYLTAKWSHMKVTEFFIGFGPRLWSIRRGETEYGFKPILAGAYVKIPGMTNIEEVPADDEERTYRRQPFRKRILVASAGSLMHGLIAFVLAWVLVVSFGVSHAVAVKIGAFESWNGTQTAAQAAGLKKGDLIVEVDGKPLPTATALPAAIQKSKGSPVVLTVERAGKTLHLSVTPALGHKVKTANTGTVTEVLGPAASPKDNQYLIGIQETTQPVFTSEGPLRAIGSAGALMGTIGTAEVTGLGHAFSPGGLTRLYDQVTNPQVASKAASNPTATSRIASVVGAARLATQAEHAGVYYFIVILIALNIVLGLINMLPMLPLDGGHVVIALYERIRTRRGRPYYQADAAKLLPVAYAFMAALIVIVGSAIFLDIAHPVNNPFG